MIARTRNDVQLTDWCSGDSGPRFPRRACCGNCIPESVLRPGRVFPVEPHEKPCPGICVQNGPHFPGAPKQPPATQPKWSAFLRRVRIKTKLRSIGSRLGFNQQIQELFHRNSKTRAGNKCHLRGFGGHSQRHVIESHISYGIPSSTDTRCPPTYQAIRLAVVLDNRRDASKVQIQRDDCHDNDHCCDQFVMQMRKHLLATASLARNIHGNCRSKKDRRDHDTLEAR